MYDVIAKELTQGYYIFLAIILHNDDYPEDMIIIARNVTKAEAEAIINQYPQARR